MAKVQISINDELLKRIDKLAEENYTSRSGIISFACTQFANSKEMITAISSISLSIRKIADSNEIDEESKEKLADFERIAQLCLGK